MKAKRVILINNSRLMGGMLEKVIRKTAGLDLVSNMDDLAGLPEFVRDKKADLAIVLLTPGEPVPDLLEQVIREQPSMRFLLMGVDGSRARLKWNEPHEVPLDEKNLQELLLHISMNQRERIEV